MKTIAEINDTFDRYRGGIACTGIMWDVDGEDPDRFGLPTSVTIVNPTDEMIADYSERNDAVVNYLSDRYGFCIEGFSMHLCRLISAEDDIR